MIVGLNFSVQDLSKKYLTLSPSTKNNALPAKWFWGIVTSELLPTHKKFQSDCWYHSFFFEAFNKMVKCMIIHFLLTNQMTESIKRKYSIKFCQKLGSHQTEIIQKI